MEVQSYENKLEEILRTLTEVIQHESSDPEHHPTPTEYFAVILTTLKSATELDEEHLRYLLQLLDGIIKQTNSIIIQSQFVSVYELLGHYISESENMKIQGFCLSILGSMIEILDSSDAIWRNQNMLKVLNVFLKTVDDQREKIRKISHQKLASFLQKHQKNNGKVARSYISEFCSAILQTCHRSNYKRSLHIVTFLERCLFSFSHQDILTLFRLCLSVQECEQPILTAQVFRTLDAFFQGSSSHSSENQSLVIEMLTILINNPPRTADMEAIAFYCTSLASGIVSLHHCDPTSFWSISSPHPVVQVATILLSRCESEFAQIHCAVGSSLKRIVSTCLDPSSPSSSIINEAVTIIQLGSQSGYQNHTLGRLISIMRGILHLRFQHAWIFVLDPIRALFSRLTGLSGRILLGEIVQSVSDIYHAISTGVMTVSTGVDISVRDTLVTIIQSLTLEQYVELIPLRRPRQPLSADLDTSRDWIITVLHSSLKSMPCRLHDFNTIILSAAKEYNALIRLSLSHSPDRPSLNESQISVLRTRVIQLWSLFPSFCSSSYGPPLDIPAAFPTLIPVLDAVLKDPAYPELLIPVTTGLTHLASSVREKYSTPLPPALPQDISVLQTQGAVVLIPSLLSLLEGMDVSSDSMRFQPAVKCISAWASVAASNLVTKVSKRLLQLLLSSTDAASVSESVAASWLAVILALIPYQSEQMVILLYRTIKPLLSVHESVSMQKRAYKVLHGLLTSHSECLFKLEPKTQILALISDSLLTCHVSARHIRLLCVASLIEGIVQEENNLPSGTDQLAQACASVFCETLICLKDANKKSRDGALHLLKIIFRSIPPHLVLPHLYAGIVGETPAMRSAAIVGLCILVQYTQNNYRQSQYENDDIDLEDDEENEDDSRLVALQKKEEIATSYSELVEQIGQLLPTVLLLLKEESVEETRAVLALTKVAVNVLSLDTLSNLLPTILEAILGDSLGGDGGKLKAKFSSRVRSIVRKAWQRVGEDFIRPLLPPSDTALLDYIQRQGRRAKSKKEAKQKDHLDKIIHDESDSDDSDSEDESSKPTQRTKPTRTKAIKATDFVGEGLPSTLDDLLEDQSGRVVARSGRTQSEMKQEEEDEEEFFVQVTKDGRVMVVPKETKSVVAASPADGMELEGDEKPIQQNKNMKDKSENQKKRIREPGEEYRSKKAGGDVWKKGMLEPHAYIPLDARLLTKKNEKNAIAQMGVTVQNATKRRIKETSKEGPIGTKRVSTMLSRKQRQAQAKNRK